MDPKKLAGLGVPMLRTLFSQVFGQETASNNAAWLRRKLAEAPDSVHGQRRSPVVRARDQGAAIWNQDFMDDQQQQQGFTQAEQQQGSAHLCQPEAGAPEGPAALAAQLQQQQHQGSAFTAASMLAASAAAEVGLQGGVQLPCTVMGSIAEDQAMVCSPPDSPGLCRQWDCPVGTQFSSKPSSPSALGKRGRQSTLSRSSSDRSSSPTTLQGAGSYHTAAPLARDTISDSCCGQAVLVYWPADKRWWDATLCKVNTGCKQLQLLYADMTEEMVSGRDYDDLLDRGHLLVVQELQTGGGQHWPNAMVSLDKVQSAPSALEDLHRSLCQAIPSHLLQTQHGGHLSPSACAARAANAGLNTQGGAAGAAVCATGATCMGLEAIGLQSTDVQQLSTLAMGLSCPQGVQQASGQGAGPWHTSQAEVLTTNRLSPDIAVATTTNSSRRSTRDGFLRSTSGASPGCDEAGDGSGNNSASCDASEAYALPHKRQCVDGSGSDPDADTDALVADGCSSPTAAPAAAGDDELMLPWQQQQHKVLSTQQHQLAKDPSQLGLWFASQQLQQLHLAEQAQHNLELQQQFSMQQQAAAHMQFRAAEHFMQQRIAATSSLSLAAAAAKTSMCILPPIAAPRNTVRLEPAMPLAAAAATNASGGCVPSSPLAALGSCVPPTSAYAQPATGAAGQSVLQNCAGLMAQAVCLQQQQQQVSLHQAAQLAAQLLHPGSPVAAAWRMVADQTQAASQAAAMAPAGACCSPKATCTSMGAHQDTQHCPGSMSMPGSPGSQHQHHQLQQPLLPAIPHVVLAPVMQEQCAAAACASQDVWDPSWTPEASAPSAAMRITTAAPVELDPETASHAPGCMDSSTACKEAPHPDGPPAVFSLREVPTVSGFTGGLQGLETLDEVDTLLSRPEQGLFGDLDSELVDCGSGHNDCAGCWDLLQMAEAPQAEGDPEPLGASPAGGLRGMCGQVCSNTQAARVDESTNMCTAFPVSDCPAPTHHLPEQEAAGSVPGPVGTTAGGFGLPVMTSAGDVEEVAAEIAACQGDNTGEAKWGGAEGAVLRPSCVGKGSGRPNSALAHVFDYA